MLTLPLTLLAAVSAFEDADDVAAFAAPKLLLSGTKAVGQGQLYPSPVLFDVDGDGDLELVTGNLMGRLWYHERAEGDDPAAWSRRMPLKGANGEGLEFDNW